MELQQLCAVDVKTLDTLNPEINVMKYSSYIKTTKCLFSNTLDKENIDLNCCHLEYVYFSESKSVQLKK